MILGDHVHMEGVDYATPLDEKALFAAGKKFAIRYIGPGGTWKHMTRAEYDRLVAAGLMVALVAEGAATDMLSGSAKGVQQAQQAQQALKDLGLPENTPIYFAADWDVQSAQWSACRAYLQGAASVVGLSRVGIYAGYDAVSWAVRDGVATLFWQTYAWSEGRWHPANHVEQYKNGVSMAGGSLDLCRSKQDYFGQIGGSSVTINGEYCSFGDKGWAVNRLQMKLADVGFTLGQDGIYGDQTAGALVAADARYGGILGADRSGHTYGPSEANGLDKVWVKTMVGSAPTPPPVTLPTTGTIAYTLPATVTWTYPPSE